MCFYSSAYTTGSDLRKAPTARDPHDTSGTKEGQGHRGDAGVPHPHDHAFRRSGLLSEHVTRKAEEDEKPGKSEGRSFDGAEAELCHRHVSVDARGLENRDGK